MATETLDQIEKHIEETRNKLNNNLSELQSKLKNSVDWRVQFDSNPAAFLGVGFALGLLLSRIVLSAPHRSRAQWDIR